MKFSINRSLRFPRTPFLSLAIFNIVAIPFYLYLSQRIMYFGSSQDFWATYNAIRDYSPAFRSAPIIVYVFNALATTPEYFMGLLIFLLLAVFNLLTILLIRFSYLRASRYDTLYIASIFLSLWLNTLIVGRGLTMWRWTLSSLLIYSAFVYLSISFPLSGTILKRTKIRLNTILLPLLFVLLALCFHPFSFSILLLFSFSFFVTYISSHFKQKSLSSILILLLGVFATIPFARYIGLRYIDYITIYSPSSTEMFLIVISLAFSVLVLSNSKILLPAVDNIPCVRAFSYAYCLLVPLSLTSSPFLLSRLTIYFILFLPLVLTNQLLRLSTTHPSVLPR